MKVKKYHLKKEVKEELKEEMITACGCLMYGIIIPILLYIIIFM